MSNELTDVKQILSNKQQVVAERQAEREIAKVIVKEVVNYGVSQKPILYIIRNLALELENPATSRKLYNAAKEEIESSTIILSTNGGIIS